MGQTFSSKPTTPAATKPVDAKSEAPPKQPDIRFRKKYVAKRLSVAEIEKEERRRWSETTLKEQYRTASVFPGSSNRSSTGNSNTSKRDSVASQASWEVAPG